MLDPQVIADALETACLGIEEGHMIWLVPFDLIEGDSRDEWAPDELAELIHQLEEKFNIANLVNARTTTGSAQLIAEANNVGLFVDITRWGQILYLLAPPDFGPTNL